MRRLLISGLLFLAFTYVRTIQLNVGNRSICENRQNYCECDKPTHFHCHRDEWLVWPFLIELLVLHFVSTIKYSVSIAGFMIKL